MIRLERFCYCDMGTFGRLYLPGGVFFTVERPWRNNEKWISCIPPGQYLLEPAIFRRGGYHTFEVSNVPNRDAILFHRGNTMADLAGCIAPGMNLGCVNGMWAVVGSGEAFRRVFHILEDLDEEAEDGLTLLIENALRMST